MQNQSLYLSVRSYAQVLSQLDLHYGKHSRHDTNNYTRIIIKLLNKLQPALAPDKETYLADIMAALLYGLPLQTDTNPLKAYKEKASRSAKASPTRLVDKYSKYPRLSFLSFVYMELSSLIRQINRSYIKRSAQLTSIETSFDSEANNVSLEEAVLDKLVYNQIIEDVQDILADTQVSSVFSLFVSGLTYNEVYHHLGADKISFKKALRHLRRIIVKYTAAVGYNLKIALGIGPSQQVVVW